MQQELESLRKAIRKKFWITFAVCLVAAIVILFAGMAIGILRNGTNAAIYLVLALIAVYVIPTMAVGGQKTQFKNMFKNSVVKSVLEDIFTDLVYDPNVGLKRADVSEVDFLYTGDRFSSDDYIEGTYKGVRVIQSDLHIERQDEHVDSKGHTRTKYVTLFKGKWMIFEFNKSISSKIQIIQKGFKAQRGAVSRLLNSQSKVEMEDTDFNKRFAVYCPNAHDAFYVLTPALMEKIKEYETSQDGKMIFAIVGNRLHVGVDNGRNDLEVSTSSKVDVEGMKNSIREQLELVLEVVNVLNLDNDLYKKGV